ncbi:2-oxoglutarate dehydrogenase E1 component [Spirosoma montaniterrae]|uniref:oxoglutarate dehydrogenase (succinyl-transferring) n=1 Tax=Spirosoma montaniterrae TaxID=1178516 RepID=A0A1P9WZV7_9BACT|nr:2-oxoglutarate dehydrogenase E1 component [Spirosoma montaniterrae]AQG80894.1 2-oxoglutarate dehydrogenase subunit E1 [Spirosoma montaniterrae]
MDQYSYIANSDAAYVDQLYQSFKQDPQSVDASWQQFFKGFEFSLTYGEHAGATTNGTNGTTTTNGVATNGQAKPVDASHAEKEVSVASLIKAYRSRGHLLAKTNPLRERKDRQPRVDLPDYALSDADLNTVFESGKLLGIGPATLRTIMESLRKIYAGNIGFEYMYIRDMEEKNWLRNKIEKEALVFSPSATEKTRILEKLNEATVFENFLATKYLGQKRFSLEGGESTIPALDTIISTAADLGVEEVMIGMAHRGRLNVLVNILGKSYEAVFDGFEGNVPEDVHGDGDVKYHLGYSSLTETPSGKQISVKLAPNPSHLEAVNPVVEGFARAQGDEEYSGDFTKILPILIHGDAAVAGQGIVYEVTQMAKLKGYQTGGTVHFVINNQVGFTTDFDDARSSIYCSDIAKIIDAPIFHVNGDDPEAVIFCAKLAVEFRERFSRDVFIDMVCYRRYGHNESDEPKFTQPTMYNIIDKHANPREIYNKFLIERGDVDAELASRMDAEFKKQLQDRLDRVKQKAEIPYKPLRLDRDWAELRFSEPADFDQSPETGVPMDTIQAIGKALVRLPEGFKPLKQIEKLLKDRQAMLTETNMVNWGTAELLAYGSLLLDGKPVRLSGQDVQRGTFSHRHAVLHDIETNEVYSSLDHIQEGQRKFQVYNSLLSEYGVLGFEYGYAMATPHALVIWEAQFGDFSNGAQTIIDQFIAAGESKWGIQNGVVMLLPHGYEGQGPEHSNARPERYLQLYAEYNMVVANVTSPANFFHLLRRQVAWQFRKPLVVMSPKSLLRHPKCVSPLEDLTKGSFQEVLGDSYANPKKVKRVLLCTGKVYYDLLDKQQADQRDDVAIVRLEQLAPLPQKQLDAVLASYGKAERIWVQEEPENMGAWTYLLRSGMRLPIISRHAAASPATGFAKIHTQEQAEIVRRAFE